MRLERKETHQVEPIFRNAAVVPDSINEEKRTVEVVFSTGAKVRRFSWWEGFFHVSLSLKREHVRLDRLNRGAPVLNQHLSRDLNDVLGVVENAKIKKNPESGEYEATATLRFSEREAADVVFKDIKTGIIRNVSVGFEVHEFEELEPIKGRNGGDPERHFLAVDWEPFEISPVGMPADPGAQVRSKFGLTDCEFNLRGDSSMKRNQGSSAPNNSGAGEREDTLSAEDIAKRESEAAQNAVKAERERLSEIRKVCQQVSLDGEFMSKLLEQNPEIKVDEVRQKVIEELGNKDKRTGETRSGHITVVREERDTIRRGMVNAICHRNNARQNDLTEEGGMFRRMRLSEMARHCLEASGTSTRGMSDHEVVGLTMRGGFHSTSDFPEILADTINKTLRDAYEAAPQTWLPIAREVEVSDFKEISRVQLGDAPSLLEVPESGEIKDGTVGEATEKYFVKTYARKLTVTRKTIVNDDLAALTRLPEMFGRAARDLESDLVWAIITGNPLMGDGVNLFASGHGNLAGSGAAISVTSLGEGRAAMRKQTGLDGRLINVMPVYLFVPAALETVAEQYTTQNFDADASSNTNPFRGKLQPIAEPRLDANSATAWYLAGSPSQIDVIEVARLIGESGPVVETMNTFEVEGMKMKVRSDFGAKAIDWRGLWKNPGA